MYGKDCIHAITKGLETNENDLPLYPRKKAPEFRPEIPDRIKALKSMRVYASRKTGIEPGFLLSNATIAAIAHTFPKNKEELGRINTLRHWQIDIIGDNIIKALEKCS